MSAAPPNGVSGHKLILAFLPRGDAHRVAQVLYDRLVIDTAHFGHGRGAGMLHTVSVRDMVEVDMLSVVVPAEKADEVFAFIYEAGDLDRPGGGLLVQAPLARAAALGPPLPHLQDNDGVSG